MQNTRRLLYAVGGRWPGPSRESQFDLRSLGRYRDTAIPTSKFYRDDRRHGGRATRVALTLRITRTRWNIIRGCRWQRFQPLSCPVRSRSSYYSRVSAAKLQARFSLIPCNLYPASVSIGQIYDRPSIANVTSSPLETLLRL